MAYTYYKKGASKQRQPHKLGPEMDFALSEAYKLFRTNLIFSFSDKEGGRVIGMTSSRPQDGKSFCAINLAYSLAQGGNRVVLIDADMRRSSIATTLGKPLSPGLSNYLVGDAKDVIHKNVLHENLSLISAGDPPPNPAELIGSERMKQVLTALRQRYDYIIVDLPPVNLVSDPLVISKLLDGIVLIVRHGFSKRREVLEAVRKLRFVGAPLLGTVYNGHSKGGKYRHHSYYSSDEGYSKYASSKK